ncbi:MAG: hypothetical protein GY816_20830, partial [Cytophagales bacterium]|nr:hypothetical protein [Cytophagales bacterium]
MTDVEIEDAISQSMDNILDVCEDLVLHINDDNLTLQEFDEFLHAVILVLKLNVSY